jgi:hypothetical protein
VCLLTIAARPLCSHSRNSSCRNLHCRPTLIAGISLHSARRQTARVEIPSHRATAAVVNSISGLDRNLSMKFGPFSSVLTDIGQRTCFLIRTVRRRATFFCAPRGQTVKDDDALFSVEKSRTAVKEWLATERLEDEERPRYCPVHRCVHPAGPHHLLRQPEAPFLT